MSAPTTAEPMLDRIRKILTKAEDPACTVPEAEAFTAKAAELIAKYGVDQALLAADGRVRDLPSDRKIVMYPPYVPEKVELLNSVAEPLRCKAVILRRGNLRTVHLFGFGADLERVELLYTSLLIQQATALRRVQVPYGEHKAAYRRSWLIGYARAIYSRLMAAERYAVQDATPTTGGRHTEAGATPTTGISVALVLASRVDEVEAAKAAAYPNLGKPRRRRLSGDGRSDGYAAGRRANLGGTGQVTANNNKGITR